MSDEAELVEVSTEYPIWDRFFNVSCLVVVGTREGDGWDLAPKHMAMPLGWGPWFSFVCTPEHSTYHNAREHGAFTVSYPRPSQVLTTSLTAAPRCGPEEHTPGLEKLATVPARTVEGILLEDAYAHLECELDRILDGFDGASLIVGRVVRAAVDQGSLRTTEEDDEELIRRSPLLAYLDPGRYAELRESYAFPFPEDFER